MSRRSLAAQFVSPQKKSVIWRIFAENAVDRSKADCNICKASVSRGGANVTNFTTTNLWSHLKVYHKEEHTQLRDEEKKIKEAASASGPTTPRQSLAQLPITESLLRTTKYASDDPKAIETTRLIMEMIALDDLPFQFVENVGFRRLMAHLDRRYQVPSAKHFRQRMIQDVYGAVRTNVAKVVQAADSVSFTTDTWSTPQCTDSLISLTAHWIDVDWLRRSAILHAQHIEGLYRTLLFSLNFKL